MAAFVESTRRIMSNLIRYKMIFSGRVQGVGFRYKANYAANRYRLTGYVKNEYDGSVKVEVQGSDEAIDMFIHTMNNDMFIKIHEMEKEMLPVVENERDFKVKY